ncbi:tetratricopeptide repeat protein [Piscinibacter sp. HJYY11]|uniref:tetratricopeptide repeat protein n=1 Tax=Piscinibacter sp. HJYY11 TaxID=2801333 RepID=UPI00191E5FE3|nr:tetratricopeptide repeat protein [Piscinibacter sp. HJYY11]MBL0726387.1 tetratricopeptide repeat protein [Piscinibacter sp. HJYY11]
MPSTRPGKGKDKELPQRQLLQRAVTLLRGGQLDEAEPLLVSILQRWPGYPDALHFLGVLEHIRGRSEQAVSLIRQAIVRLPGDPGPLNNLGNVLVESQRYDEAEKAYRDCLAFQPDQVDALTNLATLLRRRRQHAEAEALCRRAVKVKPDFALAWYTLSLALVEQGHIDEALAAHSRGVALAPKQLQARNAMPRALVHRGRLDDAARLYRAWLEIEPDNPVVRHHLAACVGGTVPERASDAYVEKTFDAFAATFDANLAALDYRAPQLVSELLQSLLAPPSRQYDILDLGCGTGLCGPLVREWARELSGCDLSQGMLAQATRRRVYDRLDHAELVAHLNDKPRHFDVLVCADTLCYFGELQPAMTAAAAALRPGGRFVFTVEAWKSDSGESYKLQPHGRYAHHRGYLRRLLAQAGLGELAIREETLRIEGGQPVSGWLVAAQLP